jgi:hypothetical protein
VSAINQALQKEEQGVVDNDNGPASARSHAANQMLHVISKELKVCKP